MNISELRGCLEGLDAFNQWVTVRADEQRALDATPVTLDTSHAEHLKGQLEYLEARREQLQARSALMVEVANQDEMFLPLAYRLGTLAAFEATKETLPTRTYTGDRARVVIIGVGEQRHEQHMYPDRNPVGLASQVGAELERLQSLLDSSQPVPVAMVWHHTYVPPRISYNEVVAGEVVNPRQAFVLQQPRVVEVDGVEVADFALPARLPVLGGLRVVTANKYSVRDDRYRNPTITTLRRLGVIHDHGSGPDALYVGEADVTARLEKAEKDNAENASKLGALRRTRSYGRRRQW